ncbi:MAG: hypothetical protein AB7T22_00570 [Calditrichaceae bacterium]
MELFNLYLLSAYLKKWSYGDGRISINYSYCTEHGYDRHHIDTRIGSPGNMVNEIMNNVFYRAKEKIFKDQNGSNEDAANTPTINLVNDSEVNRKLSIYISKILKEYNHNKRSRGKSRMISTRSLDFYYNDFEFEPLSDEIKFYVHLNRGVNKINGDLWENAVEDIKQALQYKPDDITANKYIAQALNKLGRHEQALPHLKICAEYEKTPENLNALAGGYSQVGEYKDAESVYKVIGKKYPDSNLALFGRAQLAYKLGKGFKSILDKIFKNDPEWLKNQLKTNWEYKIPENSEDESTMWNAATAARYLGFERPFDLTRRAFNDDLPSYFDSERGTIRFVKSELDNWVELTNRYQVDGETYKTYEDRLLPAEKAKARKKRTVKKKEEKGTEADYDDGAVAL